MPDSLFVIAVDFGTAYSGYAFSVRQRRQAKPDIRVPLWTMEPGMRSPKTRTCILFDENEIFQGFGFEALMKYTKLRDVAKEYFFFENFKMELYGKKIHRGLLMKSKTGKSMRALKVFSESLRFMKDHALERIGQHTSGKKFIASDATWVLIMPAIWGASAKQFMKEAAKEAGMIEDLDSDRLVITLEPEAASVWCKQLPSEGFLEDGHQNKAIDKTPGTQYIVAYCGGGTIDITVHEVLGEGILKELHKTSGNDLGGQRVDCKFETFLRDVFSEDVWSLFKEKYPSALQKTMHDFSIQKCIGDEICLELPSKLISIAEEKGYDLASLFQNVEAVEWDDDCIIVSVEKLKSFHEESLQGIEQLIHQILSKPQLEIKFIILVGGFAESKILRDHMQKHFSGKSTVLCPAEPQTVVLKGAVLFGFNPTVIQSRVSALTYGIVQSEVFNPLRHQGCAVLVNKEGRRYCNVFKRLVKIGESVGCEEVKEIELHPVDRDQKEMTFLFLTTDQENAIKLNGLDILGHCTVPMPDEKKGFERSVKLEIRFGFTEMQATATDLESNEKVSIPLKFLSK